MTNIKFKDLASNNDHDYLLNNKSTLKAEEMASILGGAGCETRLCENKRDVGVEKYCQADTGACVSGLGVCTDKTDGSMVPYNPAPNPLIKDTMEDVAVLIERNQIR